MFIELVKPVMARSSSEEGADADKQAYRETLWICLDTGLRYGATHVITGSGDPLQAQFTLFLRFAWRRSAIV